jgi:hypothetical protein
MGVMAYEIRWEPPAGFYVHFTGWVTPESAARLARELTSDPRYDDLRYAIVDLSDAPGHTFRRNDRAIGEAMVELIGAGFSNQNVHEIAIATDTRLLNFLETYARYTPRPFRIFATLDESRRWLAKRKFASSH